MNCPNKSLKDWNDLVDKVGVQQAYLIFIKNGNKVPYIQNRESNRFIWDVENKKWSDNKALVTWVKEGNVNTKKRTGFDRNTAAHIIEKIKAEYIGDYNVFMTTPDTKGEFGIKLTGMPLLRSLFEVSESDERDAREDYENYKLYQEFKLREEEANEGLIPPDVDIELYDQEQRITYGLKAANVLLSDKSKQVFEKGKKNNWDLNKILTELSIPKEQKQLLLDLGINDREQLSLELSSKYSYSVEVNTAKFRTKSELDFVAIEWDELGFPIKYKNLKTGELKNEIEENTFLPTSHYKDLSARNSQNESKYKEKDGWKYQELEFKTPLITPSIKGHAQFATDNGIGWARVWYNKDAGVVEVQEIQSDLFQKGRDKKELNQYSSKDLVEIQDGTILKTDKGSFELVSRVYNQNGSYSFEVKNLATGNSGYISREKLLDSIKEAPKNQFLQLLNKDNNWVTFFIKSIIQDSAKKGYEKVLFPKGETAAKIEGHETIAEEIRNYQNNIDTLKNNLELDEDVKLNTIPKTILPNYEDLSDKNIENGIKYWENKKNECISQGVEKLKPIEAFYEIKVGNILEKQFGKENVKTITDEYGNQWRELDITDPKYLGDIELQRKYQQSNITPTEFNKQKRLLSVVMPYVTDIIEDRSLPAAGMLHAGGKVISVNPAYITKDTLGHEYGHLLIDLRGGMKDPFIQQGRKQLEGTPIERRVMDLYPELYGTERFDKEVLAQAIGEEVADIFDSAEKRNTFAEWLLRLFKWLGTRTGITKNNAKELARQLTGETELDISRFTDLPSSYVQEQRAENADDITDKDIEDATERIKTHEIKQETKSRLELLREQAEDITATRLRTISHKGNSSDTKRLEEVLTELRDETLNNNTALRAFVTNAVNHINRTYSTYLDLKTKEAKGNKDAFNIRMIERWYDIFAGYDVLDEVASYITSEYNILDQSTTKKYISLLNDAINKKNTIRDMYKTKGIELLSDDLSKYSTQLIIEERENKKKEWLKLSVAERKGETIDQYAENYIKANMVDIVNRSKALLTKEMQVASDDINWLQRWLDTILDSNDMVLAATVKKIVIADRKARAKSIEFKGDLINKLRKLEESTNYSHYTGKIEDLYDFMLEKDSKGKPTGHILTKFSSALMDEYRNVLNTTAELPLEQRWAERNKWKEANMPLDRQRRDADLTTYMKSLIKDNILSEDEYKVYFETASMPFRNRPLLINVMNTEAANHVEEWLVSNSMSYRNPISKWENKGWKELENILKSPTNPKAEYYNLINGMLRDIDRNMPFNKRIYSALPVVSKTTLERFQGGESAKSITKDYFSKTFQKHSDDTEKGINTLTNEQGEPIDFIPTRYLRNKNYDLNDQSFDLSTIYYLYNRMANNYIEKSDVQAEAELVKTVAQTRKYTVRDSKGNVINKVLDARKNKALTKSGSKALIVDQYSDFLKLALYGQTNVDEGDYNVFGYKVDKAKAHGLLGKYTAYNMLGLNVIQGLSNINMGELQQLIEGIANEYFSVKDLHNATIEYTKNLFSIVGDVGNRSKNNVVNALNEKFDVLNEYEGGEFRKNSKFANLTMTDALFFMAHAGEHFMQSRVMIAMLQKKVALDSNGKVLGSMYDMYKVENGKLVIDKRVDLEKSNWNEEEQILYGEKIKRLLSRLHGEYSELGRNAVQKYSLGRLGIMFRKFIVPGFKKRFEKKTPNEFLEEYTEGSYRELGHFFKQLGKSIYQLKLSMITDHWSNLLPREKSNVKRAVSEVMAMFMCGILATAFLALKGESDDDDEKMLYGNMAYLALRGRSELSFYYNPVEAMAILRSPAASMSTIENILKMLGGMMPPDFTMFERYKRGPWKGELKIEKNLMNFIPAYRQYYRVRDIDDVLTNFSR